MALEITELKNSPADNQSVDDPRIIGMPTRENIKFDSIKECKKDPVMDAVDKNSFERHGISAENMYKSSLILSFGIMDQSHHQGPALNVSVLFFVSEEIKNGEYKERSKVLNVKNIVPSDLFAEVL